jgi:hypothetical protein
MESRTPGQPDWGVVPPVIAAVAQLLATKIEEQAAYLKRMQWSDEPGDVQDDLNEHLAGAHRMVKASTDMRALLTAYAHRFHEPRPVMAELARAQETSRQGVVGRYGEGTIRGIQELLSRHPNVAVIYESFKSLSMLDLASLPGAVGAAASEELSRNGTPPDDELRDTPGPDMEDYIRSEEMRRETWPE